MRLYLLGLFHYLSGCCKRCGIDLGTQLGVRFLRRKEAREHCEKETPEAWNVKQDLVNFMNSKRPTTQVPPRVSHCLLVFMGLICLSRVYCFSRSGPWVGPPPLDMRRASWVRGVAAAAAAAERCNSPLTERSYGSLGLSTRLQDRRHFSDCSFWHGGGGGGAHRRIGKYQCSMEFGLLRKNWRCIPTWRLSVLRHISNNFITHGLAITS